ncbi:hypothetical protein [Variovorax sp. IB41]|uniref:hypothetical protein n=1 Tax=Variovorax sp. IB41 TaxID=2779370 RepID=UPI0018E864C3|nr:hypothetical protein [Variovorax sp. IB41]MBJ2156627.1 hypothetical protein [Variovorax sp. IB41]
MSVTFHDGTNLLYRNYTSHRGWNNTALLGLNPGRSYDRLLIDDYNNEAKMKELFARPGAQNCYPGGPGASKLGDYVNSDSRDVIVIKGLHQWVEKPGTAGRRGGSNYQLHITFGLDGQLWHLYATYFGDSQKITFSSQCSVGEKVSHTDHEGFSKQGRKK